MGGGTDGTHGTNGAGHISPISRIGRIGALAPDTILSRTSTSTSTIKAALADHMTGDRPLVLVVL
jgi:hypothetical protein